MTDIGTIKCGRCRGTGIDPESVGQPCNKCSGLKELDWIQNVTGFKLTRKERTLLYVINTLNSLAEKGLMTDGGMKLNERSKSLIQGFKPSQEEIKEAIDLLRQEGYVK